MHILPIDITCQKGKFRTILAPEIKSNRKTNAGCMSNVKYLRVIAVTKTNNVSGILIELSWLF